MAERPWTEDGKRVLRAMYATAKVSDLCRLMNRSRKSIHQMAKRLGLRNERRYWTADQIAVLRAKYATTQTRQLARELGRGESSVYQMAKKLGLQQPRLKYPEDLSTLITQRHSQGWSDTEIAAEWSAAHPQQPIDRRTLRDMRAKLGLPHNAYSAHRRACVAAKTREQLEASGVRSLAELRSKRYREYAVERGWPVWLRPRQVQILDVLYECGPLTREEIVIACGMKTERAQRYWLSSKYGRGSYLADLAAAGFVVRSARREVFRRGGGNSQYRYWLATDIQRGNPATWPEKEVALERIYGKTGAVDGVERDAASAVAGGADVSGAVAGRRGRQRDGGGRRRCRQRDRVAG